jgi:hypothetical protein
MHKSVDTYGSGAKRIRAIPAYLKAPVTHGEEYGRRQQTGTSLTLCKIAVIHWDQVLKVGLAPSRGLTALEEHFYEKLPLPPPVRFRTARFDSHGL